MDADGSGEVDLEEFGDPRARHALGALMTLISPKYSWVEAQVAEMEAEQQAVQLLVDETERARQLSQAAAATASKRLAAKAELKRLKAERAAAAAEAEAAALAGLEALLEQAIALGVTNEEGREFVRRGLAAGRFTAEHYRVRWQKRVDDAHKRPPRKLAPLRASSPPQSRGKSPPKAVERDGLEARLAAADAIDRLDWDGRLDELVAWAADAVAAGRLTAGLTELGREGLGVLLRQHGGHIDEAKIELGHEYSPLPEEPEEPELEPEPELVAKIPAIPPANRRYSRPRAGGADWLLLWVNVPESARWPWPTGGVGRAAASINGPTGGGGREKLQPQARVQFKRRKRMDAAGQQEGGGADKAAEAAELAMMSPAERAFKLYDADGNGMLDLEEVTAILLDQGGTNMTAAEIQGVFEAVDLDGSGTIGKEPATSVDLCAACEPGRFARLMIRVAPSLMVVLLCSQSSTSSSECGGLCGLRSLT
eukprot:SAG22_NODE_57_length_23647_cov_11.746688_5_plen_482_part_00